MNDRGYTYDMMTYLFDSERNLVWVGRVRNEE